MQPDERDAAYLWDMLQAARDVREFTAGLHYHQFLRNRPLQLATERCIEIVGEAARHVSAPFHKEHPEIPWKQIIGQRNVLAHEYGSIKQDRMWEVATVHIPRLITLLEPLIPPIEQNPP